MKNSKSPILGNDIFNESPSISTPPKLYPKRNSEEKSTLPNSPSNSAGSKEPELFNFYWNRPSANIYEQCER